jgi:hypothetical protein
MFKRGISDGFVQALKKWKHWDEIIKDHDLFVAIRNKYINIYFQGCSLFKASYNEGLVVKTHYKYLVRPNLQNPYVSWVGDSPALEDLANKILVDRFDLGSLKTSSRWYGEPEKAGLHRILKRNTNVVDVEVALSPESEVETDSDDRITKGKRVADRIDFAAVQKKEGRACIVFFEAKRFDNGELRSQRGEPRVFGQIRNYGEFINNNAPGIKTSYGRVCKNLVDLAPDRTHPLVREVVRNPEQLTVDPNVRLVVFGFDQDQRDGTVWNKHKTKLEGLFGTRLLLKGSPSEFTSGISN